MEIQHTSHNDVQLLKLSGRLVSSVADDTRHQIFESLKISNRVVIDCSELEYLDSTGLGSFILSLKHALKLGGDLRLAEIIPKVSMLLELTKADKVFKIFATVDEAISSFETNPPKQQGT